MTFFILSHFVAEIHLFLFIIYLSKKKKKKKNHNKNWTQKLALVTISPWYGL